MKFGKSLFCTLFLLAAQMLSSEAKATAQESDYIIINGKIESLNTNPLRPYLDMHPDSLPKTDIQSTGNWRGYVATWEIADDKLVLKKIEVEYSSPASDDSHSSSSRDVTPQLFADAGNTVATWYSGTLIIPKGEIVQYVHMGYGSTYDRYSIISVKDGLLTRYLDLSLKEFEAFRDEKFEAYKKSEKYAETYRKSKKQLGDYTEGFIKNFDAEEYLSGDYK